MYWPSNTSSISISEIKGIEFESFMWPPLNFILIVSKFLNTEIELRTYLHSKTSKNSSSVLLDSTIYVRILCMNLMKKKKTTQKNKINHKK